jgi:ribonuclease R
MARHKKKSSSSHDRRKISSRSILAFFHDANRPLRVKDVLAAFSPSNNEKKQIKSILDTLVNQGKLLRSGHKLALVGKLPLVKGVLEVQRSGVGFVIPEDKRRKDIFVAPDNFGEAWPNDTVLVAILPGRRGRSQSGRIVRVLKRALSVLPCLVLKQVGPASFVCRPADPKIPLLFTADCTSLTSLPQPDDIILVAPDERIDKSMWMGTATAILGEEGTLAVQEQLVKIGHAIPGAFPTSAMRQAADLPPQPSPDDFKNRKDLRHLGLVTIDGASARDFDDAIHVARTPTGFRLHVAIADVSHYVLPGSPLDREALERGNSYYFPLSVEPMLPKTLSNGLCSLNPRQPRLAMVAEMEFSSQGIPLKSSFYPAVIMSHARLTYAQVNEALFLKNPKVRQQLQETLPMLETAEILARKLLAHRKLRGSIDFDLPEPEIIQDPDELAIQVVPKKRHFGHQMIEEFMLAANEAVAQYLTSCKVPFLYRVHPEPDQDKLDALMKLLARTDLGEHLPQGRSPKELQELLHVAKKSDMEFLVNRLLLRSMMKAGYSPNNQGHFGLASQCYCHFTSPIRRYADINVHRALKACLGHQEARLPSKKSLMKLGDAINQCERKAMQAEREILKRATILHLREHIGEVFVGVISGLADFGFWVELQDILAEGLVRMSTLGDDYYAFLNREQIILGQRTGKTYKLGQKVKVRVENVSLGRLEIDLGMVDEGKQRK